MRCHNAPADRAGISHRRPLKIERVCHAFGIEHFAEEG
jgi:hypothetical protein